jgi:predicted helicase
VVNFIVRAVDDVLKTEFGLADGLADTSKVTIDWDTGETKNGKAVTVKKEVHRVQILDPAAGTGTFLAEVIKQIAPKVKDVAEGQWSSYVEKELIPRLHGFELLMASYAMCHMKLDMMLTEMGYKPTANPPRMGVYLTNSLEEGDREIQDLFWAKHISEEAKHANAIKRDMPIMCVIGNPPYSGISHNNGEWITGLIEDYKYIDGEHFGERKHWLQDDYVKFIRFAEKLIEKNGEGILGFITNHGYLDSPTFRGMRWHLRNTFDKIWILDLHGNAKKKEVAPDGSSDHNVFDIQQGVSIIVGAKFAKHKKEKPAATFQRIDLWGTRERKYENLWNAKLDDNVWVELNCEGPSYRFSVANNEHREQYERGFYLTDFFSNKNVGMVTGNDAIVFQHSKSAIEKLVHDLCNLEKQDFLRSYSILKEPKSWKFDTAKSDLKSNIGAVSKVGYRPFDQRFTYYTGKSGGFVTRPIGQLMPNFIRGSNLGINFVRPMSTNYEFSIFVCDLPIDQCFAGNKSAGAGITNVAPLYLYPDERDLDQTRRVNFDPKIHKAIIAAVAGGDGGASGKHPLPPSGRSPPAKLREKGELSAEVAIFDYIYGVLHCPAYRETYKEFLKIDFPRVPYPPSPEVFWDVSAKGTELRKLHLMEDAAIGPAPYKFTGVGDTVVGKVKYEGRRVAINDTQGFDNVPEIAWTFYIGGYQPAQKWLKDRKGRELSFEDIKHYQKIIKILSETDRIMKTIEMPL